MPRKRCHSLSKGVVHQDLETFICRRNGRIFGENRNQKPRKPKKNVSINGLVVKKSKGTLMIQSFCTSVKFSLEILLQQLKTLVLENSVWLSKSMEANGTPELFCDINFPMYGTKATIFKKSSLKKVRLGQFWMKWSPKLWEKQSLDMEKSQPWKHL